MRKYRRRAIAISHGMRPPVYHLLSAVYRTSNHPRVEEVVARRRDDELHRTLQGQADLAFEIEAQVEGVAHPEAQGGEGQSDLQDVGHRRPTQGLGGHGEFVERPDELKPAIERALASNKPALLNIAVERAISPRAEAAIGRRKVAAQK